MFARKSASPFRSESSTAVVRAPQSQHVLGPDALLLPLVLEVGQAAPEESEPVQDSRLRPLRGFSGSFALRDDDVVALADLEAVELIRADVDHTVVLDENRHAGGQEHLPRRDADPTKRLVEDAHGGVQDAQGLLQLDRADLRHPVHQDLSKDGAEEAGMVVAQARVALLDVVAVRQLLRRGLHLEERDASKAVGGAHANALVEALVAPLQRETVLDRVVGGATRTAQAQSSGPREGSPSSLSSSELASPEWTTFRTSFRPLAVTKLSSSCCARLRFRPASGELAASLTGVSTAQSNSLRFILPRGFSWAPHAPAKASFRPAARHFKADTEVRQGVGEGRPSPSVSGESVARLRRSFLRKQICETRHPNRGNLNPRNVNFGPLCHGGWSG
eukprot:scaffold97_cov261-Pinguiococcus_pyrenoidosus.AAC.27